MDERKLLGGIWSVSIMFSKHKGRHSRLGVKKQALGATVDNFTWCYKMLHNLLALPHDLINENPKDPKGTLKLRNVSGG